MINVIAIDSIRNLPMNATMGLSVVFFYCLGTLFFLVPCILVTAELATQFPRTGGAYVWVREAFGRRIGFVNIWLQWIYNVVWFPTILVFIAATATYLFDPSLADSKEYLIPVVIFVFMAATFVNLFGVHVASWLSTFGAILGTLLPMAFIIVLGGFWYGKGHPLALSLSAHNWLPQVKDINDLSLIVVILFSLIGIEMSAVHAGDVKNPKKDYPRSLVLSSMLIVTSLIFSSLAIAIVVPAKNLNIVSGLADAFQLFLNDFHLTALMPVVIVMILMGAFAGMSAWVLGPARGLMIAAEDGCLPKWYAGQAQNGSPVAILLTQALVVGALTSLFLEFKSINTFYWILSDLTGQLALVYYLILFAAAIRLRHLNRPLESGFQIPGGKIGMWMVGGIGIFSCVVAIIFGFIPPSSIQVESFWKYELTLIIGMLIFIGFPWILYRQHEVASEAKV